MTGRPHRVLPAVVCALLSAWSALHYRRDERLRRDADRFAARFGLDRSRPLEAAAMRLEPAGDLAMSAVVDAALRDSAGTGRPDELAAARDLMLEAVASRPGWAFHLFLLGRVAYLENASGAERWLIPLRGAAAAAPGADVLWTFLGGAYLERWQGLRPGEREAASPVLDRAFLDAGFVSREFPRASAALGRERTLDLLPNASGPLSSAAASLARAGEVEAAARLLPRISRAETSERAEGLRRIEERFRLRDLDQLREMCASWVGAYPPGEFDNARGRAQTARVLELWPHFQAGPWKNDRRARLVRFFLDGREESVKGDALRRAVEALSGVPPPIAARVRLLAGDPDAAEELVREAGAAGSLDWTPYFLERARWELKRGRPKEARDVLERNAPGARGECDVLLARRAVALALRDAAEAGAVSQDLRWFQKENYGAGVWSRTGSFSLCLDPAWAMGRSLKTSLVAERPVILSYGWNGGRAGTLFLEKSGTLTLPLAGLSGRNTLWIQAVMGGPVRFGSVLIDSSKRSGGA